MKQLILTLTFILAAMSANAQLGNIPILRKDSTLQRKAVIPAFDSTGNNKRITQTQLDYLQVGGGFLYTRLASDTPSVAFIPDSTFRVYRKSGTDSISIWYNIGGTLQRAKIKQ